MLKSVTKPLTTSSPHPVLAFKAPSIGSLIVGVKSPEKAHPPAIHKTLYNVLAYEGGHLHAVHITKHVTHQAYPFRESGATLTSPSSTDPVNGARGSHKRAPDALGIGQIMPTVAKTADELLDEARRLNELLKHKTVKTVWRHRPDELAIEFEDGTRLFVDGRTDGLEFSIT